MATPNGVCLNLLTKIPVAEGLDPLARIWSLDHWLASLDRVLSVKTLINEATHQRFELIFDAGHREADHVVVERFYRKNSIEVIHLVAPPGIKALTAEWWVDENQDNVLFAKRKILIDEDKYTPVLAKKMFVLLRENIEALLR